MPNLTLLIRAASLEAARQQVQDHLPDGYRVIRETVKVAGHGQADTTATAATVQKAKARALAQLPLEAIILNVETVPEAPVALILETHAAEEPQQAALDLMVKKYGREARLLDLSLHETGGKGWWGLGKRRARYRVDILKPARCTLTYQSPVEVEFTAALAASVSRADSQSTGDD